MNVNELSGLLHERPIEEPPIPAFADTMGDIRGRVTAARRRLVMSAIAAVAVVVAIVTGFSLPSHHAAPDTIDSKVDGFPKYLDGFRVIATAESNSDGVATLTTTENSEFLTYLVRCPTVDLYSPLSVRVTINGRPAPVGGICSSATTGQTSTGLGSVLLENYGVDRGSRFTLAVHLESHQAPALPDEHDQGPIAFSLAAYESAPFREVPLPPRPATLPDLQLVPDVAAYTSDPQDPTKPVRFTATWHPCKFPYVVTCLGLTAYSSTPGEISVDINGVPSTEFRFFDYSGAQTDGEMNQRDLTLAPTLHDGDQLSVTLTPSYVTGPWAVQMSPPKEE
jgi:hypothetical protein